MKKSLIILTFLSLAQITFSQEATLSDLPYREIPNISSNNYTAGTIAARMLDGLGFRYYWATDGLRAEDLAYRPNKEVRSTAETLDHILGLVRVINNATNKMPTVSETVYPELDFVAQRAETLNLIKEAAEILRTSSSADFENYKIIFKNVKGEREYPFWNQINGPISDTLWHLGQVVSFRRSSGNPFASGEAKPNLLTGKVKE